ncbi:glycoside hydrolase family 3 C-terminal domain-containing protein [Actinomadura kijaniata]|uniref:Exo-alpha-(1->6)-L-arabinopyranosidase n=1 Tax=Actinomadura namibiensis TaxID=182080 RepID=A0A7W3M031_ACTNM|nr:glycoside hydrolase family 3 C-terminal domain-containing protein [Actinomadura namibiensis]MBA8957377.1 beta-glucosidase [Actinomadura namibiensis]
MPSLDLGSLSLERKASLLSGRDMWSTEPLPDAGLPEVLLYDGPHGLRYLEDRTDTADIYGSVPATCFPPAVAVGASWDPEVAAALGAALGREARALGVTVVLGPGVNIKRSPLCGRNFEYYSEDPLLSGVLGAAHVRGLQGEGPGASVKHFAANNQETDRTRISADVDERTLREIYLPAFERIVTEARPATVMASYNKINGVHATENRWLLTEVLRQEWGFTGAVISDWGAVHDRVAALAAGLDLEMPGDGGVTDAQVVAAVRAGELDEALVDQAVARVVALAGRVTPATGDLDVDGGHALARTLAADCVVLLKNDGEVLPLEDVTTVAVIGAFATTPRFQGGGSSRVNPTRVDTPLDEIAKHAADRGQSVTHAQGFTADGSGDAGALREEAVTVASNAQVAVVFAGLSDNQESEGYDRETIELPAEQVELIHEVARAALRTVVVLSHGGVMSLEGWHDEVDAIVDGTLLGQAGGGALADVLYGVVNPSGHLAETVPLRLQDNPSYLNFPGEAGHVRYGEGVMVGYRYYTSADRPVGYPFGHGLSYTTFSTDELTVTPTGDDTARVSVTVTNTGTRAGKHVVQVYVATTAGKVRRPARELRAFTKIALEPGESRTVVLDLDRRSFAYYDITASRWAVGPGEYRVQIGADAHHVLAEAAISLTGDKGLTPLSMDSTFGDWLDHPIAGPALMRKLSERMRDMTKEDAKIAAQHPDWLKMAAGVPMSQMITFTGDALPAGWLEELIEISRSG